MLYRVICGDFSGIQVFWAPSSLLHLISSTSALAALTTALGLRIYYLPLFIFLIVLTYIIFVTFKIRLLYRLDSKDFLDEFIELNVSVLGLGLIALIIYAISGFILYFYGLDGTLKPALMLLFKSYTAIIILYHYLMSLWLRPFYARSYGRKRARLALQAWIKSHLYAFCRYTLVVVLLVLAAVKLYQIFLSLVLTPVIDIVAAYTGYSIQLQLRAFQNIGDIWLNVGILILAFLVSNIIFYPLVCGVNYLARYLFPMRASMESDNA